VLAAPDCADDVVDHGAGRFVLAPDAHVVADVLAVADDEDSGLELDSDLVVADEAGVLLEIGGRADAVVAEPVEQRRAVFGRDVRITLRLR